MKHLKMLGVAVVAVAALTAVCGAGSASATVLCRTAVNPCPEAWRYPAGTSLHLSLQGHSVWEVGTEVHYTCTSSTITGKTTASGSSIQTVPVKLETLNTTFCTYKTDTLTLGELEIHSIAGTHNGTITMRGTSWTVNRPANHCIWQFPEWTDIGTIKGGNPATVEISVVFFNTSCIPYRWTANYTIPSPTPLYVEAS